MSTFDDGTAAGIAAHTERLERATGVPVATAVVQRADAYAEVPWKAFALGVSLSAGAVVLASVLRPVWVAKPILLSVVAILAIGALGALCAVLVPSFGRLFVHGQHGEVETRTYAHAFFLRHDLVASRARNGLLILISRFERRVEIVADVGLHSFVDEGEWQAVIERMTPLLRRWQPAQALHAGLDAAEALLLSKGLRAAAEAIDEWPNRPLEEDGR